MLSTPQPTKDDAVPPSTGGRPFLGWSETDTPTVSFSFGWKIHRFRSLQPRHPEKLQSGPFTMPGLNATWSLLLYPFGEDEESMTKEDLACLSVYLVCSSGMTFETHFALSLSTEPDAKIGLRCATNDTVFGPERRQSFGWKRFLRRQTVLEELRKAPAAAALYVRCDLDVFGAPNTSEPLCRSPDLRQCADIGRALLADDSQTDVTLLVDGHAVSAHNCILSAASPVFRAMFQHSCIESATSTVEVKGYSLAAVQDLKRFLYTGQIDRLREVGWELLDLAGAYDIPRLAAACAAHLPGVLDPQNACRVLAAAHLHGLPNLRAAAAGFIWRNIALLETDEWREVIAGQPDLVHAFCTAAAPL
jgi:hypothetical protein